MFLGPVVPATVRRRPSREAKLGNPAKICGFFGFFRRSIERRGPIPSIPLPRESPGFLTFTRGPLFATIRPTTFDAAAAGGAVRENAAFPAER
jgi:hypothetical protein